MTEEVKGEESCFLTYEDRADAFLGVQLLALSLSRYATRNPRLIVYGRPGKTPDWFREWAREVPLQIRIDVREHPHDHLTGWNVKARLILDCFHEGFSRVTWLDSDMIVNRPIEDFFDRFGRAFVLASEPGVPDRRRTEFLGLDYEEPLAFCPNTCIIQASRDHEPLLTEWVRLIESERYQEIQAANYVDRPVFMVSDQDVLAGILASSKARGLGAKRVAFVSHAKDILQYGSVSIREVLRRWRGLEDRFVHNQGLKPWWVRPDQSLDTRTKFELSPYLYLARQYRRGMSPEADLDWLDTSTGLGRLCR